MSIWVVKILPLRRSAISFLVTQTGRLGIVIPLIVIQILSYVGGDELRTILTAQDISAAMLRHKRIFSTFDYASYTA